jgi:hypothetical protein
MSRSDSDISQPSRAAAEAPSSREEQANGPYIFESLIMPSIGKDIRNFVAKLRSLLHLNR